MVASYALISSPLERNTRTPRSLVLRFFLSSSLRSLTPTRSALPLAALKIATFDWWIDRVLSTTPPVMPFIGFGLTCFLTTLTPSTISRSSSTRLSTVPRRPLSRPVNIMTWSPFRILFIAVPAISRSEHFRRERDDLHEALGAELARHWAEDARADRLELGVQQHGGVAV